MYTLKYLPLEYLGTYYLNYVANQSSAYHLVLVFMETSPHIFFKPTCRLQDFVSDLLVASVQFPQNLPRGHREFRHEHQGLASTHLQCLPMCRSTMQSSQQRDESNIDALACSSSLSIRNRQCIPMNARALS